MNKREIGSAYEQKAVEYLEKHGIVLSGRTIFADMGK